MCSETRRLSPSGIEDVFVGESVTMAYAALFLGLEPTIGRQPPGCISRCTGSGSRRHPSTGRAGRLHVWIAR